MITKGSMRLSVQYLSVSQILNGSSVLKTYGFTKNRVPLVSSGTALVVGINKYLFFGTEVLIFLNSCQMFIIYRLVFTSA